MRLLVYGSLLAGAASSALAADIDNSWLRGSSSFPADPPTYRRWSGFYGGGQIGLDFHAIQFNDNGNAMIANLVAQDPILVASGAPALSDLARRTASGLSYGGFAGYNYQIDDTVFGLELNVNGSGFSVHTGTAKTAVGACPASPPSPAIPGGNTCQITVNASNAATATLAEYGTMRIRGGWAYGSFLPYVVVGLAIGRVNSVQTVNVNYSEDITAGPNAGQNFAQASYSDTAINHGKAAVGFSGGIGIDYLLYQNVFVRSELEYLQFGNVGALNLNALSLRTGLGMKF